MLTAPQLSYAQLAPILIVLGGALLGVLIEAIIKKGSRAAIQTSIALGTLVLAFAYLWRVRDQRSLTAAVHSVAFDGVGIFIQATILILSIIAIFYIADTDNFAASGSSVPGSLEERSAIQAGKQQTEVFPLTLFAVAGMLLFPIATDLITLFVALEMLSLPLYLMAGLSRRRRLLSHEAALKYFLLGAFSSAFFLFGSAFLYGYSGTITLDGIATAISANSANDVFLLIGIVFLSVGLLFKIGAVPFHSWTPDVYQGAPTPITGFMAACTKIAAMGATLRIFYVGFGQAEWQWKPIILTIAILTMVVGGVAAIAQRDVKRMLAFSSIAHAGFLLAAVLALNTSGLKGALFYLATYGFTTLGAFGIITLVRDSSGEVTDLNRWVGLGKKSPLTAGIFTLFLLSFAGIPLTSGFIAKFSLFTGAYESGNTVVVVVGVLTSAITAFFYLRVVVMLFFTDPKSDSVSVVIPSLMTRTAIAICAIVTVVLGLAPSLLLSTAQTFAAFMR
jgi:NADH-quinone oxidoreductase subunit N